MIHPRAAAASTGVQVNSGERGFSAGGGQRRRHRGCEYQEGAPFHQVFSVTVIWPTMPALLQGCSTTVFDFAVSV
jgi:hypothetical protein